MNRIPPGTADGAGDNADPTEIDSQRGGPLEVFRVFLLLGCTSFGGPTAHLGYFRNEFVERRRWIDERRFGALLGLCQFIPGPASSQLGFAIGLARAGWAGALCAWLAFTLPSAVLMIALAMGASLFAGAIGQGVLAGLRAVAVAVVAHAIGGMARTLTPDLRRILIALGAALIVLFAPPVLAQPAAIIAGGGAGLLLCRSSLPEAAARIEIRVSKRIAIVAIAGLLTLLVALPLVARLAGSEWLAIVDACFRAGTLVFGGGHVVLPLLQGEPAIASALGDQALLAGYGAAQAMPGPLFTFAGYIGAAAVPGPGAIWVGIAALVAVFVPGILILIAVLPLWERIEGSGRLRAGIAGAGAAVVGILVAALIGTILPEGAASMPGAMIAALAFVALFVARIPVWGIVLAAAGVGAVLGAVGW